MNLKLFFLLLLITGISACSDSKADIENPVRAAASRSVKDFVGKEYKDYALEGDTLDISDIDSSSEIQFYLHLTKNGESKVVPATLRKFHKEDGSEYWVAYKGSLIRKISDEDLRDAYEQDKTENDDPLH